MGQGLTALKMLLHPHHASASNLLPEYERAFARCFVGAGVPTLAFGRGRVALWSILRAMGADDCFEVIVPAYTCETVPMAVKFAGAQCIYGDVDPGRYNVSLHTVARILTSESRAIICQHTYGIRQPVQDWIQWAIDRKVLMIEDRCQLVEGKEGELGPVPLADAAYFSTHFSKPYSTAQGGMAAFSNMDLYTGVRQVRDSMSRRDGVAWARSLALQTLLYAVTVRPMTRAIVGRLFRWAQRAGLIRGTVSRDEYGDAMPDDYLSSACNVHAAIGKGEFFRWEENQRHRRLLTRHYLERLASLGIRVDALQGRGGDDALLMVPILVTNKEETLRRAAGRALPIGTWFDRCPAHLDPQTADRYDYRLGQCPNAEYLVSKEIHLLTAPWVSLSHADRAIEFLAKYAHWAGPVERSDVGDEVPETARIGER